MPVVDMPLSELKEYKGINPKPKDFDEFWERGITEMNGIDPDISLTEYDLSTSYATCYNMYFTGVKGSRIYAKVIKPKNIKKKCPAILYFHGYTGASCGWTHLLSYVAEGFVVAALDCRGQGGKSNDTNSVTGTTCQGHIVRGLSDENPDNMYYRNVFLDTAQLAKIVMEMEEVDEENVGVFGGSQGGALSIACASLVPKIKCAVSSYPFLSDYKRIWDMDMAFTSGAYVEIKDYFRHFDPRHENEFEIFEKLGYIDVHHLAPKIKGQVKIFSGLMDNICAPSSHFAVYNSLVCKKDIVIYPDFGHEWLPDESEITFKFLTGILK